MSRAGIFYEDEGPMAKEELKEVLLYHQATSCQRAAMHCALLIIVNQFLFAQSTFHNLYPIETGNKWEYSEDVMGLRVTKTVIDDTTINSSVFHTILTDHQQWGNSFESLRVTGTGEVVRWENEKEVLLYKLDAAIGDNWLTGDSLWIVSVDEEGVADVFGMPRYYKIFTFYLYPDSLIEINRLLAWGIGLVSYNGHIDAPSGNLVGAIIGDTTHGTLSSVVRNDEVNPLRPILTSHPNPFNSEVTMMLHDALPRRDVQVTIYDALGRRVISFRPYTAKFIWDSRTGSGSLVPSGVYFAVIQEEDFILTHKLLLLR